MCHVTPFLMQYAARMHVCCILYASMYLYSGVMYLWHNSYSWH